MTMEAVPPQSIGSYGERPVSPLLARVFAATWVHRMPETVPAAITVSPDGTIDLQWIDGRFRIAGPDKEQQVERLPAGATVIGFRFQPGAAAAWLGVPAHEILGARLALADVIGAKARLVQPARSNSLAELVASLEHAVARHSTERRDPDRTMQAAFRLIDRGPPPEAPLVPWLCRGLAMSDRTLRRRFDESFGYGPKTLDRILRFQRFRRLARQADASTAILAAEAGYADQAHLVRESRRLTGITPQQLAQSFGHRRDALQL
jgi:AraC-like DNA-binding protein